MAYSDQEVIDAALAIRPLLRELLGDAASEIDVRLADLLTRWEAGEEVADTILALLRGHEAARGWVADYLSPEQDLEGEKSNWERAFPSDFGDEITPAERISEDPPRQAFALLSTDDVVVVEQSFELKVGLSPEPVSGLAGQPIVRPPSSIGDYILTVQVVADGFSLGDPQGQSWRQQIPVTAENRYPVRTLNLLAHPGEASIRAAQIEAYFSIDGHPVGWAVNAVVVVAEAAMLGQIKPPQQVSGVVALPTGETPPDLTVVISQGKERGRLLWTFQSPPSYRLALPDQEIVTDIGDDPQAFARQLMRDVNAREGKPGLYALLLGNARVISRACPKEFFENLAAAAIASGKKHPTVLILSSDPYVPWELAAVQSDDEKPLLDPDAPPFLSTQAVVGRWVLHEGDRSNLPPPEKVKVRTMAAISGRYEKPRWRRLEAAEQEAAELERLYEATPVNADMANVLTCLRGHPEAQLLHFAMHGIFDPDSVQDGLVLVDEATLAPAHIHAHNLRQRPFVFLNACQVGQGNKILGDYAGLSESFLAAGASGVVAPLWSINDKVAKEIALRFYGRALGGEPTAAILREERSRFGESEESGSATPLAYQFFGHPEVRFTRASD